MSQPAFEVGIPDELLPRGWVEAVGFIRSEGKLRVAFPKVYDDTLPRLGSDTQFRTTHLIRLIRVLARYSEDVKHQPGTQTAIGISTPGLLDWLEAAVELYEDYLLNGLYWVKQGTLSRHPSNNAIHWGHTLSRSQAVLVGDAPVFLEPYRRLRSRSSEDFLHRLHASLLDEIGNLLTGRSIVEGGQSLDATELERVREAPRQVLSDIGCGLFADRPKKLVQLIGRYLQASSEGAGSFEGASLLCRSENFELVWEHMLRNAIQNSGGATSKPLPAGRWVSVLGSQSIGIRPRIDFAYAGSDAHGDYLAIFDAKDRACAPRRTGSEQDHYKQVLYALLSSHERLFNVLVFPSIDGNRSQPLLLTGLHEWEALPGSRVFEASADYAQVCDAFVRRWIIDPRPFVASLIPMAS